MGGHAMPDAPDPSPAAAGATFHWHTHSEAGRAHAPPGALDRARRRIGQALAGLAGYVFLEGLDRVTELRLEHQRA